MPADQFAKYSFHSLLIELACQLQNGRNVVADSSAIKLVQNIHPFLCGRNRICLLLLYLLNRSKRVFFRFTDDCCQSFYGRMGKDIT
nr:hypothetical protein [Bacillus paralicheniformis]